MLIINVIKTYIIQTVLITRDTIIYFSDQYHALKLCYDLKMWNRNLEVGK